MSNQVQVLDSDLTGEAMTDNGDGTYTYSFTPTRPGEISFVPKKVK